jgi:thiamine-phosphate pyrophosphorylase
MTNLIVISSEVDLKDEAFMVNELFHEGMELFHLRKPEWMPDAQRNFLKKIRPEFLNNISVHQNYQTVSEFKLKYYHVTETGRRTSTENDLTSLIGNKIEGFKPIKQIDDDNERLSESTSECKKSTSFHDYTELQFESHLWNYCFLSPLFDSISKPGHKSAFKKDFHIEAVLYPRVFALGGITQKNIEEVFKKEFYGAAVLGSVWQNPAKAVKNFKELKEICKQNVHTY